MKTISAPKYFRQRSFFVTAITVVFVIALSLLSLGLYSSFKSGNVEFVQWMCLIIGMTLLAYILALVFGLIYLRTVERLNGDMIDAFLSMFPNDEQKAIKMITEGDNARLSRKSFEWYNEQRTEVDQLRFSNSVYNMLFAFSSEIFFRSNKTGTHLFYGDYWEKTYGFTELDNATSVEQILHLETLVEYKKSVEDANNNIGKTFEINGKLKIAPNSFIRVRITATSTMAFDSVYILGSIVDLEPRKSLSQAVSEEHTKLDFMLPFCEDLIYEVDVDSGEFVYLNPERLGRLFSMDEKGDFETLRRPYWDLIHPDYRETFLDRFLCYDHILMLPDKRLTYEYRIRAASGDWIWVSHTVKSIRDDGTRVKKVIGCISDINERKRREFKQHFKSQHDSLTGALLFSAMKNEFEAAVERGEARLAVVLFDVNGFKHINNQYGFETGDLVLRQVVSVLWERQKGRCVVGRIDDDIFMTLMLQPNSSYWSPQSMITGIFACFQQPQRIESKTINVSLSVGFAEYPADGDFFDAVYGKAAFALNVAKTMPRFENHCVQYTQTLRAENPTIPFALKPPKVSEEVLAVDHEKLENDSADDQ